MRWVWGLLKDKNLGEEGKMSQVVEGKGKVLGG